MSTEIERKFLVRGSDWKNASGVAYCQGYLNRSKERTVRMRIAGGASFFDHQGHRQWH